MTKQLALILITCAFLLVTLPAWSQFTPSNDAYTNTATPTSNFGAKPLLDVQSASQTSYITFDLSPMPAGYTGANVSKATLKLYVNGVSTAGSFNVDLVNGAWSESTITANLAPALGGTVAASVPLATSNKNDYVIVDVTSAVQAWLNGNQPNDGLALLANSPLNATFDSKESTTQSHPPELDIVFASGAGTLTGVTTASSSGLSGGGTSGTLNLSLTNSCSASQVLQWNGSAWACANASSGGTVTSVGLGAPASDFVVSGSPVTSNGTLALNWIVPPDVNITPNAIVKRDANGNINVGSLNSYLVNASDGVYATAFSNYAQFPGFALHAVSTGTYGYAIYAQTDHADTITAYQTSTNGNAIVANSAGGDGILATGPCNASCGTYAGWFNGDVDVNGTLYKSAGNFKIDHPLDPANKYLYHSFVESPDMMNIYNGNAVLDNHGEALVQLPDWFEALNRDFRYSLTPIGAPANLYIAEEVSQNHFKIAGGQPGGKVSWQVTGIRHDAYADAHRSPVEEVKPERERGFYRNPELFGAQEEKGILWARHPETMKRLRDSRSTTEPAAKP